MKKAEAIALVLDRYAQDAEHLTKILVSGFPMPGVAFSVFVELAHEYEYNRPKISRDPIQVLVFQNGEFCRVGRETIFWHDEQGCRYKGRHHFDYYTKETVSLPNGCPDDWRNRK